MSESSFNLESKATTNSYMKMQCKYFAFAENMHIDQIAMCVLEGQINWRYGEVEWKGWNDEMEGKRVRNVATGYTN